MKIVLTQGFTTDLEVAILREDGTVIKRTYDTLQGIEAAQDFIQEHVENVQDCEIIARGHTRSIQALTDHLSQPTAKPIKQKKDKSSTKKTASKTKDKENLTEEEEDAALIEELEKEWI